jgi:hypothetical protein
MRNLVVLLTIAVVLACPYQCAIKLSAAVAIGSNAKPACCEDCEPGQPTLPAGQPTPNAPAPEDGRSCLCEGAVFDAGVRSPVDDLVHVFLWGGIAGFSEFSAIPTSAPKLERSIPRPTMDGSFTRIAICSLLL